jgi:hypothetical protein
MKTARKKEKKDAVGREDAAPRGRRQDLILIFSFLL